MTSSTAAAETSIGKQTLVETMYAASAPSEYAWEDIPAEELGTPLPAAASAATADPRVALEARFRKVAKHKKITRNDMKDLIRIARATGRSETTRRHLRFLLERLVGERLADPKAGRASFKKDALAAFDAYRVASPGGRHASVRSREDGSNRVGGLDANGDPKMWPIEPNTKLVDGIGVELGVIERNEVKLNYGQRKTIRGKRHVYVFAAKLVGKPNGHASGWVREKAVPAVRDNRSLDPSIETTRAHVGKKKTPITGGTPEQRARYAQYRFVKNYNGKDKSPSDYLWKDGVVNLNYSLPDGEGGMATDTFKIDPERLVWQAATDEHDRGARMFHKGTNDEASEQFRFVYGKVHDEKDHTNDRFGWIARAALGNK